MYDPRKKTLVRVSISLALAALLTSSAVAQSAISQKTEATGGSETITSLPDLTTTTAGEPLHYLSTPDPVVSSDILTVPPGKVSRWMVHPVPAYLYVLQGDLTLEFVDGKRQTFHTGAIPPAVANKMAPRAKRWPNSRFAFLQYLWGQRELR